MTEHLHIENLIRLSGSFVAFDAPLESPPVSSLPALKCGHVTFGSFAGRYRVTPDALRLWAAILRAVPESRMMILPISSGKARESIQGAFAEQGIAPWRIELRERMSRREFLCAHEGVDIVLDTFPCNGMTTTCHHLWMGVPVVTLAGRHAPSRAGVSLLTSVGLERFIAQSPQEYRRIAVQAANDLTELSELRTRLRDIMRNSVLMDGVVLTRKVEDAYRHIWQDWCDRRSFLSQV